MSRAQDIEAGDGTTSVVVIAGALLEAAERLLQKDIHPTLISESFQIAAHFAVNVLKEMAKPLDMTNLNMLYNTASTSLNSKVVSQYSIVLSMIAVDAVLKVTEPGKENAVDLKVRTITY